MPVYDIDLSDGRTITVEADSPPSEQDVMDAVGSFQESPSKRTLAPAKLESTFPYAQLGLLNDLLIEPTANLPANLYNLPGTLINAAAGRELIRPVGRGESVIPEMLPSVDEVAAWTPPPSQYSPTPKPLGQVGAGLAKGTEDLVRGVATPEVLMTMGGAAPETMLARAPHAVFAAQMTQHLPEAFQEFGRQTVEGTTGEAVRSGVGAVGQAGAIGMLSASGAKPIKEIAPPIRPEVLLTPEQAAANQAAILNLMLPPRAKPEPISQAELTAILMDQAVRGANAPYGRIRQQQFEQPLAELKAQELIPIAPELPRPEFRPGGGEAIGGKVSFNQPAESRLGLTTGKKEAPPAQPAKAQQPLDAALRERGYDELAIQKLTPEQKAEAASKPVPTQEADAIRYYEIEDAIKAAPDFAQKMDIYNQFGAERELIKNRNKKATGYPPERPQPSSPKIQGEPGAEASKPTEPSVGQAPVSTSEAVPQKTAAIETQPPGGASATKPPVTSQGPLDNAINSLKKLRDKNEEDFRKGRTSLDPLRAAKGVAIDVAILALEATKVGVNTAKAIKDAIEKGIQQVRFNIGGLSEAQIKEIRKYLESELGGRDVPAQRNQPEPAATPRPVSGTREPAPDVAETAASSEGRAPRIESPEGQKPRSFSSRATVSEKVPEPVQEAIATDPRSSYTEQPKPPIIEEVKQMPDAELAAMTPNDSRYTLGKAELADRLFDRGKLTEGANVLQTIAEDLTRAGQIVEQAKVLNALKPENKVIAIDQSLKRANKDPMTPRQKQKALEVAREVNRTAKELEDATTRWERDPSAENNAKADAALDAANKAALELQRIALDNKPRSIASLLKGILQGNLLSPMSQSANLVGNLSFLPARAGVRGLATSLDILRSAVTGKKRQASVGLSGVTEAAKGAMRGIREIPGILRHGTGGTVLGETRANIQPLKAWVRQFSRNPDIPTVGGKLTLADRAGLLMEGTLGIPAEAMLRMLGAVDRPFREAGRARAIAEQLRLAKVPKSKWEMAQKFPEIFLSDNAMKIVESESAAAVFQRQSHTLNALTRMIAEKGPWFDFAVATVAPYKTTPWNIIGEILSYNPVVAFWQSAKNAKAGSVRDAQINTAKFVVGTTMAAVSYMFYENGLVSPSLDNRDETMKERIASGDVMPPNHLNLSGLNRMLNGGNPQFVPGDETVDIMRSGGLMGAFMYMTANIGRDLEKLPESGNLELAQNVLTQSTLEQARFGMNQSFLSGVESLLSAVKDGTTDSWVGKYLNTLTSVAIPNTTTSISRATREYKPDLSADTFNKKVENTVRNRLGWAGLDDYLPLRRGLWGDPMRETPEGRNAIFYQLFDVFKGQQITSDPVAIELYRLWRTYDEPKALPTPPKRELIWNSKKYPLTPELYEELAVDIGQFRRSIVEARIGDPEWRAIPDENKVKLLGQIYDAGLAAAKVQFWEKHQAELEAKPRKAGFKVSGVEQ